MKVWKGMSRDYELEHRFENLIKKVKKGWGMDR